ncbi:MAG: 2-C-methyl-D-erythritol 4-phosphate cytidylyltransferase [Actinomycetota bacterium]|nr:2-C-methyl-D-erythritol 4-phosphate cytidylyltransferase [Actinomycetota bacterium]
MNVAIITAAGKGTRLKSNISKQFLNLYGKPIVAHTLETFQKASKIDQIYLVVPKDYLDFCTKNIINKYKYSKIIKVVLGGSTRQQSVYRALKSLPQTTSIVSVHDGVRPLVTADEVDKIVTSLQSSNQEDPDIQGVIMAAPAYETIKKIKDNDIIEKTIQRDLVWHAQTPQVFFYRTLMAAHKQAIESKFTGTDDAGLVELVGYKVKIFRGRHENIKITTPTDLFLAELIMSRKDRR